MAFALFAVSAVTRIVSPVTVRPDSLMLFSLESSAANFIYLIINGLQHIFTTMASPELTQNLVSTQLRLLLRIRALNADTVHGSPEKIWVEFVCSIRQSGKRHRKAGEVEMGRDFVQ